MTTNVINLNAVFHVVLTQSTSKAKEVLAEFRESNSEALNSGLSVGDFYVDQQGQLQVVRPLNLSLSLANKYTHFLRVF